MSDGSKGVALVTGASHGIGEATVRRLAKAGYSVAVHYRTNEALTQGVLESLGPGNHRLFQADFATLDDIERLVDNVVAKLGTPTVLVHSAGLAPSRENKHQLNETDVADWIKAWRNFFDVNILASALLSHRIAHSMLSAKIHGKMIFIGSRGAHIGEPRYPAYGVSKAAIHALAQTLATSLAPHGISVTAVAPGFIETSRIEAKIEVEGPPDLGPFGRLGTPDEVAAAIEYLASPEGTWAAGAIIDLNGASHLR